MVHFNWALVSLLTVLCDLAIAQTPPAPSPSPSRDAAAPPNPGIQAVPNFTARPEGLSWPPKGPPRGIPDAPIGFGAATTGGKGGPTVRVGTADELVAAVAGSAPKIVIVTKDIVLSSRVKIGSNTSLLGVGVGVIISKSGLDIQAANNVIVRNLKIENVLGADHMTIINSTNVWIDHNEFSSECCSGGPDEYDGSIDIVRGSSMITVSWNYVHDHWKANLIGNSDNNRAEDSGKLKVTLHHNYYHNMGTRGPAARYGQQHVYNNIYHDYHYQAMHSRSDNQMLIEGNKFSGHCGEAATTYGLVVLADSPNTSLDGDFEIDGYMNLGTGAKANDFGTCTTNVTNIGNFTAPPYKYKLTPLSELEDVVKGWVGIGMVRF